MSVNKEHKIYSMNCMICIEGSVGGHSFYARICAPFNILEFSKKNQEFGHFPFEHSRSQLIKVHIATNYDLSNVKKEKAAASSKLLLWLFPTRVIRTHITRKDQSTKECTSCHNLKHGS